MLESNLLFLLLLPLIGSIVAFTAGKIRPVLAGPIASISAISTFIAVCKLFPAISDGNVLEEQLFEWITSFNIPFTLRFDSLSAMMCATVTGVGSLIHVYAIGYMKGDPDQGRFFAYLNLFLFFMLTLVLGANLAVTFIGWEGVGLCSYLLIGFWYENSSFASAGRKAFVVNRIGDCGFLFGMFMLLANIDSLDYNVIATSDFNTLPVAAIALALFIGAVGKSAQIPLFVWLPDAMVGPTPVSALIHAATMVTAGVYLMVRISPLLDAAPTVKSVILAIALLTALIGALSAISQNDIKKVLAYSTVSQLGYMFAGVALAASAASLFHLVTHAFFKACLFMAAGAIIIACHHEQDMRKMGGLYKRMPFTATSYLIAALALMGLFPFAGYYSKHAILHAAEGGAFYAEFFLTLTSFVTAFYISRAFCMVFLGKHQDKSEVHEVSLVMTLPIMVLAVLALIGGFYLSDRLPQFLGLPELHYDYSSHALFMANLPALLGAVLGAVIVKLKLKAPSIFRNISLNAFYIDKVFAFVFGGAVKCLSSVIAFFDRSVLDKTVEGVGATPTWCGNFAAALQSGQVRFYALMMFIGIVAMLYAFSF